MNVAPELAFAPTDIVTGACAPGAIPDGMVTFTWYNPTAVGVKPANATFAGTPAICTVTVPGIVLGGLDGDAFPAFTAGATDPSPIA